MADDIRVRLTPEGVKDVIDGLRRVQKESRGVASSAAKDVDMFAKALSGLKDLLPAIGLGAVAAGLFAMGKHALHAADDFLKLSISLNTNVESLSALTFGAILADVEQEKLTKGLVRQAKAIEGLRKGTNEQVDAFEELGLTSKDFAGKDAIQSFELIAQRIAGLNDEQRRLILTNEIYGRGMARLAPLLQHVGTNGFAALRKQAEDLGLVFSTDLAKASEEINDLFKIIGKRSEAMAISFLSGFTPAFAEALKQFQEETQTKGRDSIKLFGEAVGHFAEGAVKAFLIVGKTVAAVVALIEEKAKNLGKLTGDLLKAGAKGAAIGAPIGAAAGSIGLGAGAVPGAVAGAGAGAITGIINELSKPNPNAQAQIDIMDQLSKEIEEILKHTDPGKVSAHTRALRSLLGGVAGEEDGVVAGAAGVKERLANLEKRLGGEQFKQLTELTRHKEALNERLILSERKLADARAAANAYTTEGQRVIELAEQALLQERVRTAQATADTEINIAKVKETTLTALARRQHGASAEGQRLIAAIVNQSTQEQLAAETKRYTALIHLQDDYLRRYRESRQTMVSLDKEIADNRKQVEGFVRETILEGLDDEGKKQFQVAEAYKKVAELRGFVLEGELGKSKEARQEVFALAQELRRLGESTVAQRVVEEAGDLFQTVAESRKLAARQAGDEAKRSADTIGKQLETLKGQIDQFKANLLFDISLSINQPAVQKLIKEIQDELGKEPFQIAVRAQVLAETLARGNVLGVPGYAGGGALRGWSPSPTADNLLFRGTAGEFMQPVRAVRHYGMGFMESVKNLELPRFAEGGALGDGTGPMMGSGDTINVSLGGMRARVHAEREEARRFVDILRRLDSGVVG